MRYFNKATYSKPPWERGTLVGSNSQLSPDAGARPLFSDPLDEEVYEARFDTRQVQQMTVRETIPTDQSYGGDDA